MNKESVLGDRLGGSTREETGAPPTVIRPPEQAAELTVRYIYISNKIENFKF